MLKIVDTSNSTNTALLYADGSFTSAAVLCNLTIDSNGPDFATFSLNLLPSIFNQYTANADTIRNWMVTATFALEYQDMPITSSKRSIEQIVETSGRGIGLQAEFLIYPSSSSLPPSSTSSPQHLTTTTISLIVVFGGVVPVLGIFTILALIFYKRHKSLSDKKPAGESDNNSTKNTNMHVWEFLKKGKKGGRGGGGDEEDARKGGIRDDDDDAESRAKTRDGEEECDETSSGEFSDLQSSDSTV